MTLQNKNDDWSYQSTKMIGPISTAFRQYGAESHCRFIHGYALEFTFTFECSTLDLNHWCVDFGGLKPLKAQLEDMFDHKLVLDKGDPLLTYFKELEAVGGAELTLLPYVGCEAFAKLACDLATTYLTQQGHYPRARVKSVQVHEHSRNSAIYVPNYSF